jgi:hypothetical protein
MAEEHPPSPVNKDKPILQEIAGQARNEDKRMQAKINEK